MSIDSARSQPPIDTTVVTDTCARCGGEYRELAGEWRLRQCMSCGDLTVATPALRIAGPDLVAVIKAMAEFSERLVEIDDSHLCAIRGEPTADGDPTWAELYEAQVAALAAHIGRLELPGGDT